MSADQEWSGENLAKLAEERWCSVQAMTPSKLPVWVRDSVVTNWADQSVYLPDFSTDPVERAYLASVHVIRRETGAPNLFLADYIWHLQLRLAQIENQLDSLQAKQEV